MSSAKPERSAVVGRRNSMSPAAVPRCTRPSAAGAQRHVARNAQGLPLFLCTRAVAGGRFVGKPL
eukprot:1078004-Lingulodinium_polyedra.AAC.1